MKQCEKCYRFLSDRLNHCLYCRHKGLKPLNFLSPSLAGGLKIYTHEIILDEQPYNIVGLLGKGGFGTVVQICDPMDKKLYAMKVPLMFNEIHTNRRGNNDKEILQSQKYLEKEIDAHLKCDDENFLYIYKTGKVKSPFKGETVFFPAIIMELAQGTIKDIIKHESNGNKVSGAEKNKIIKEIVDAITNLHDLQVVHRDLSPDNLFIVDRGERISYVLGDLGACKILYEDFSLEKGSSALVGHPPYLDPNRNSKEYKKDYRNDIYSLGIIIVEILMGKFWQDFFRMEDIHIMNFDFEKEFLLKAGAKFIENREVLAVIGKAVKRNINERYRTIDEFRQAIFQILDIDPLTIHTPTGILPKPYPVRTETKRIQFYFTLHLPLILNEETYFESAIHFKGEKELRLSDYRGAKIVFDGFYPTNVVFKETSLYSFTIADNTLILNFRNSEFYKILNLVEAIAEEIHGELHFKGVLEIEGEVR